MLIKLSSKRRHGNKPVPEKKITFSAVIIHFMVKNDFKRVICTEHLEWNCSMKNGLAARRSVVISETPHCTLYQAQVQTETVGLSVWLEKTLPERLFPFKRFSGFNRVPKRLTVLIL